MPIIKDHQLIENAWTFFADDVAIDSTECRVLISLQRWLKEKTALASLNCDLGVRIFADDNVSMVAKDLQHFLLIEVYFSNFSDGRSFSQVYLLRHRYQFEGEIRANGDYLVGQSFYLSQIGINAFDVSNLPQSDEGLKTALKDFSGQSLWADLHRKYKKIIKNQEIIEDNWQYVSDDMALKDDDYILVSLSRWQQTKAFLSQREKHIGVRIFTSDDIAQLADDLHKLQLIELFAINFTDGRFFSQAYLLRHRYHFKGEIRITGSFVPDQAAYFSRVGVDSLSHEHLMQTQAALNDFSFHYQNT